MLAEARRPTLYTGGGIINSGPGASHPLRGLARLTGAPVTSTPMGLGAFPSSDPQWLGIRGMNGTYAGNWGGIQADLIVCIADRFDDRVTDTADAVVATPRHNT